MNAFLTTRRRAAAATLAAGALLVGGAGAAVGPAAAAQYGPFGSGTTGGQGFQGLLGAPGSPGAGAGTGAGAGAGAGAGGILAGLFGGKGTTGLPGLGVFKALFALLGAVQTQVPAIAAPIVTAAQTAGTITPAEGTQLTSLFAIKPISMATPMTMDSGPSSGTPFTRLSTGELAVLHQVIAAVLAQLPTITAPVLVAEVTNGDLTQAEADMITKVISHLGSLASNPKAVGSAATGVMGSPAGAGSLLATLEATLGKTTQAKTTKHHKHHHRATVSVRANHAH